MNVLFGKLIGIRKIFVIDCYYISPMGHFFCYLVYNQVVTVPTQPDGSEYGGGSYLIKYLL